MGPTGATGPAATNYWQLNANALSPYNQTLAFLIGSNATSSAIFQIDPVLRNIDIGTSNAAFAIDIGTGTAADTINIGTGTVTGDIISIGTGLSATSVRFRDLITSPAGNTGSFANGEFKIGSIAGGGTGSGHIWIKSNNVNYTIRSTTAAVADYSEFMLQEEIGGSEPGDVMVMSPNNTGKVIKGSRPYDPQIIGAYTTADRGTSYNDLDYYVLDGSNSRKR